MWNFIFVNSWQPPEKLGILWTCRRHRCEVDTENGPLNGSRSNFVILPNASRMIWKSSFSSVRWTLIFIFLPLFLIFFFFLVVGTDSPALLLTITLKSSSVLANNFDIDSITERRWNNSVYANCPLAGLGSWK